MIQKRKPIEELRLLAIREGMTTLLQDGIPRRQSSPSRKFLDLEIG